MKFIYILTVESGYGRYRNVYATTNIKDVVIRFTTEYEYTGNLPVIEVWYEGEHMYDYNDYHEDSKRVWRRLSKEIMEVLNERD